MTARSSRSLPLRRLLLRALSSCSHFQATINPNLAHAIVTALKSFQGELRDERFEECLLLDAPTLWPLFEECGKRVNVADLHLAFQQQVRFKMIRDNDRLREKDKSRAPLHLCRSVFIHFPCCSF